MSSDYSREWWKQTSEKSDNLIFRDRCTNWAEFVSSFISFRCMSIQLPSLISFEKYCFLRKSLLARVSLEILKSIPGLPWFFTGGYKVKLRRTDWHSNDREGLLWFTLILCLLFCCHIFHEHSWPSTYFHKPLASRRCSNWNFQVIQLDPSYLSIVRLSFMTQLPTDLNSPETVHTGSVFCSTSCTMTWPFALPVPSSAHGLTH